MHPSDLPRPDPHALAVSRALLERIAAELAAGRNWMSFARYMELALYEPGLGYYAGGSPRFGAGGDFITAPDLSPLFAQTLARQLRELLGPGDAVLEFGAGSGALAAELTKACPDAAYFILEPSPSLRALQQEKVGRRVQWLDRLPRGFCGVMLANEVLDAMPAHAVAWTERGIFERGVCANEGELAWSERPAQGSVLSAAKDVDVSLPPSGRYESELGLAARAWVRSVGASLERGVVLLVDYGFPQCEYYHPQRSMGTLQCHYRHRSHGDPFFLPGLQDITTHVDFSAMARAGTEAGLDVLGYANQAQFLVNCGITEVLAKADPNDARRYAPLAAAANLLLSPTEMGELFKVLALGRGVEIPVSGFASRDRSHTL